MNPSMKVFFLFVALATSSRFTSGSLEERQISLAGCDGATQDIFFVLDSSGSVGQANFDTMKTFVKSIISNLDISEDMTRIGVITYSRYPSLRIHLTDNYDKAQINNAVDQIPYISGITETDLALQLLQQEGAEEFRPGVPHIAIVITDGQSFHPNRTSYAAASLKATGVVVFSIGIGEEVNPVELQNIATDPDTTHVFQVTSFESLKNISKSLTTSTCQVIQTVTPPPTVTTSQGTSPLIVIDHTKPVQSDCNKTVADIMFVLDSSGSLGGTNFHKIIQFVIDVISNLDISSNLTRVGVITFSNYPTERIALNAYNDKLSLTTAISNIPYYPGNTETDKALDLLRLEGFRYGRQYAPDIAIVVTDGLSTNPDLTKTSADMVKDAGITVFAVGIGNQISISELNVISNDPNSYYSFNVSNYSELKNIENSLAKTTCDVPMLLPTVTPGIPSTTAKITVATQSTLTTTEPSTTPVSCIGNVADVVFVVDASGSVGSSDFQKVKDFIKRTISIFDIGSALTRVGVIEFSSNPQLVFGLNTYNNKPPLINAVDSIPFSAGGTDTGAALELLRKTGFLNDRADVPNVAILVTDGRSKDYDATRQQANLIKQKGITLITIGVGSGTDRNELTNIASNNLISGQPMIYNVSSYADLQSLGKDIATLACAVKITTTPQVTTVEPVATTPPAPCKDVKNNCMDYGRAVCSDYQPWAQVHCRRYCGFCTDGLTTTLPPCVNKMSNCHEYGTYICTDVSLIRWTKANCPEYCGLCGSGTQMFTPAKQSTPPPDGPCVNAIDICDQYGGPNMCTVSAYRSWAKTNCNKYCGFCTVNVKIPGVVLANNVTCPDILLPKECRMLAVGSNCCPIPQCPAGYVMTMKSPLQQPGH